MINIGLQINRIFSNTNNNLPGIKFELKSQVNYLLFYPVGIV